MSNKIKVKKCDGSLEDFDQTKIARVVTATGLYTWYEKTKDRSGESKEEQKIVSQRSKQLFECTRY